MSCPMLVLHNNTMKGGIECCYLLLFIICILLFIFGMKLFELGYSTYRQAELKTGLLSLTNTPFKGMLTGTFVTALLQSSSAVMVITIGLISARIMKFPQSIGIILGTNIGTTFTTELITFNIDGFIVPLAIIGAIFLLITKNSTWKNYWHAISFGIAAIFAAMSGFTFLADRYVTSIPIVGITFGNLNNSHVTSILTGTIITGHDSIQHCNDRYNHGLL